MATSQTREQLQQNNAPGYNYKSGAFRVLFYLPQDTLSTADSGAIAYVSKRLWLKNNVNWVQLGGITRVNDTTYTIGSDTLLVPPFVPADYTYSVTEDDCHDTTIVIPPPGDYTVNSYLLIPVPFAFIGHRIRLFQGGMAVPTNPAYGWYYEWGRYTGILRVYSVAACTGEPYEFTISAY